MLRDKIYHYCVEWWGILEPPYKNITGNYSCAFLPNIIVPVHCISYDTE